jgi:hypothetical protein
MVVIPVETRKRAGATIDEPPITVPSTLTFSPVEASFGAMIVIRVGLRVVVVAGAVAVTPRRIRMAPIAMETPNRTARH